MLKQEEEFAPDVFLVFEEQMAREGEYIFQRRSEYIEQLVPVFQQFYDRIAQEQEKVELRYVSHCQRGPLLEQLVSQRYKDKAVGFYEKLSQFFSSASDFFSQVKALFGK